MPDYIERWPKLADEAPLSPPGTTLMVYGDSAILFVPEKEDPEWAPDVQFTADELRALAKAATWAADRLDGRDA